eukprot:scaffold7542_cov124-Isochrysis_galbana.AAC.1
MCGCGMLPAADCHLLVGGSLLAAIFVRSGFGVGGGVEALNLACQPAPQRRYLGPVTANSAGSS